MQCRVGRAEALIPRALVRRTLTMHVTGSNKSLLILAASNKQCSRMRSQHWLSFVLAVGALWIAGPAVAETATADSILTKLADADRSARSIERTLRSLKPESRVVIDTAHQVSNVNISAFGKDKCSERIDAAVSPARQGGARCKQAAEKIDSGIDGILDEVGKLQAAVFGAQADIRDLPVPPPVPTKSGLTTALEQTDAALQPAVIAPIAGASLTTASILLGLAMPILLRIVAPLDESATRRRLIVGIGRGARNCLWAFVFFLAALTESLSLDPNDWAFLRDLFSETVRIGIDIGTEMSALGAGLFCLVRAAMELIRALDYFISAQGAELQK